MTRELIEAGALRQFKHNDGSEGFVCAYDRAIVDRVFASRFRTVDIGAISAEQIEQVAKAIYARFDGAAEYPWVEHGNSNKQDDARRYARAALEAVAAHPSAEGGAAEPDRVEFEKQAAHQGATNFTLVHPEFMVCNNGWTPATYRDPMTELAWRVWANKRAAPAVALPAAPELPPLPAHPEPRVMRWSELEKRAISEYGKACASAVRAMPAPEWISVEDRLPEVGAWVNVLVDREQGDFLDRLNKPRFDVYSAQLREIDSEGFASWQRWKMSDGGPMGSLTMVTHWMPLPAAPDRAALADPQPQQKEGEA